MEASGIVGKVIPRNTKVGITYSFTFDDFDDERWFGTFKETPPLDGQYVTFEYVKNAAGFLNVDMKTMVIAEGNTAEVAQATPQPEAAAKVTAAYTKSGNKDAKITWQAARNSAIAALARA